MGVYFRSRRGRYLSLLAVGLALILTPSWTLLDEFILHWSAWLPDWPSLISDGLVPLALILVGMIALDEWVKRSFRATNEERILFIFIFLLVVLIVMTVVGIYFRGPGMSLYWPWDTLVLTH